MQFSVQFQNREIGKIELRLVKDSRKEWAYYLIDEDTGEQILQVTLAPFADVKLREIP